MTNEIRFTIQKASGMYIHLPIFDNGVEMADGDVCILLNEQQATISDLKEENEQLKEELNNLKKDETMLYHYYTLARYSGDGV